MSLSRFLPLFLPSSSLVPEHSQELISDYRQSVSCVKPTLFSGSNLGSSISNVGVLMARSHLADMQSADTEPSELRRADSGVLTGDFLNTEDSTLHCRDVWWKKIKKLSRISLLESSGGFTEGSWGHGLSRKGEDLKRSEAFSKLYSCIRINDAECSILEILHIKPLHHSLLFVMLQLSLLYFQFHH